MDKHVAAQDVADHLFDFERALDEVTAKGAMLLATAAANRHAIGISVQSSADAFGLITSSISGLDGVRGNVAAAHKSIAAIAKASRIEVNAIGGGDKPPSDATSAAAGPRLVDARAKAA